MIDPNVSKLATQLAEIVTRNADECGDKVGLAQSALGSLINKR